MPDIPCVLENGVVEAARPTQPVTLHITVNIMQHDDSPGRVQFPEPLLPPAPVETGPTGQIQFPVPERFSPLSYNQPAGTGPNEAMRWIVPIYRSDTWEGAVKGVKWVMDALGPIAEVRVMPF